MTTLKFWLLIGFIILISVMIFIIQNQANTIENTKNQLTTAKTELKLQQDEAHIKLAAMEERELNLVNDRKELENEYNTLIRDKESCRVYFAWGDAPLPDSVSQLLLSE